MPTSVDYMVGTIGRTIKRVLITYYLTCKWRRAGSEMAMCHNTFCPVESIVLLITYLSSTPTMASDYRQKTAGRSIVPGYFVLATKWDHDGERALEAPAVLLSYLNLTQLLKHLDLQAQASER